MGRGRGGTEQSLEAFWEVQEATGVAQDMEEGGWTQNLFWRWSLTDRLLWGRKKGERSRLPLGFPHQGG